MNALPPTLIYFDVRGRAEPIRLILEEVDESWEEQVVSLKEWDSEPPTTPFHRLPVYCEGAVQIPETFAILSYLGRKHGLLGANAEERMRCDVTIEAWRDYGQQLTAAFAAEAESARQHFFERQHPKLLNDLETWYGRRGSRSEFWAGSLTIADFVAFDSIDRLLQLAPHLLDRCERLVEFHLRFAARPSVNGWLESTRRHPALLYLGRDGQKLYPSKA